MARETQQEEPGLSRRELLRLAGMTGGTAWLSLHWPALLAAGQHAGKARASGAALRHLSPASAATLEAVAEQIFPADETPGARDLGVIHFIDAAVGGFMAGAAGLLASGAGELDSAARRLGADAFAALDFDRQTALLQERENSPFFGTMRFLSIGGMFALPAHGGNRDWRGWQLIGMTPQHAWSPPFGHYDAAAQPKPRP